MKNKIASVLVIALTLGLGACSNKEVRNENDDTTVTQKIQNDRNDDYNENKAKQTNSGLTAQDQGNSEYDIKTTQEIRKQVTSHNQLSTNAKNVKIITINGNVYLKGPVKTSEEKYKIESIAKSVAGRAKVTNELYVTK